MIITAPPSCCTPMSPAAGHRTDGRKNLSGAVADLVKRARIHQFFIRATNQNNRRMTDRLGRLNGFSASKCVQIVHRRAAP